MDSDTTLAKQRWRINDELKSEKFAVFNAFVDARDIVCLATIGLTLMH